MNMPTKSPDDRHSLADEAAASADVALRSTQRMANHALDSMADSARELRDGAAPLLQRASDGISALSHRGADALRDGKQQLRDSADQLTHNTRGYIRDEPVKAVLIAAATGAALMALISLMSRSRHSH